MPWRRPLYTLGMAVVSAGVMLCRTGTWLAEGSGRLCVPRWAESPRPAPPEWRAPIISAMRESLHETRGLLHQFDHQVAQFGTLLNDISSLRATSGGHGKPLARDRRTIDAAIGIGDEWLTAVPSSTLDSVPPQQPQETQQQQGRMLAG